MKEFWKKLKKKVIEKAIELLILGFLAFLTLMTSLLYEKAKESLSVAIRTEIKLENAEFKEQEIIPIINKLDALIDQDIKQREQLEFLAIKIDILDKSIASVKLPKVIKVDDTDYNAQLDNVFHEIQSLKSNQDSIGDEFFKQKKRILEEYERQLNILLKQLPK